MKTPKFRITSFDLLNLSVSALRDGLSSLYSLYLVNGLGLGPSQIGWVLSASTGASLVGQIPLGYLYDRVRRKGLIVAAGALGMAMASVVIGRGHAPSFTVVLCAQLVFGLSLSTLSAGMPALTVALTKERHLGSRLMRNELFSKIGNLATLALGGYLSHAFSTRVIFVMMPILAAPVVWLAVVAPTTEHAVPAERARSTSAWASPKFYWFVGITFLLYVTGTGALPMFEQVFAPAHANGGAVWIATSTALTMAVVTLTIFALARVTRMRGLVLTLALAFALLALRLGVMSGGGLVGILIAGQMLDGIVVGILVTAPMRLLAHHFHADFAVLSGVLGAVASFGAFASTAATGPLMTHFGYPTAMLAYVAPALLGLVVVLLARRALAPT